MAKDFTLGWDLESLNKAYRQGYMAGMMDMDKSRCPYHGEIISASWEAGWEDGNEEYQMKSTPRRKIA